MDAQQVFESLSQSRLFEGIVPTGLERVVAAARLEEHSSGVIFAEGDPGEALYVVLSGKVRISRTLNGMGEEALAVLGPGDSFGEMTLVEDATRSADAIVHEPCHLLVISRDALDELLFLDRELAYEVLWNFIRILSGRLRGANDKLAFLSTAAKF